ncbi:LANO_0E01376g1_1 [Lachancea nothofagi CBS 11611]|uniref:LANO_0E01376g1_1 n=1 Tax=Lachancea nothofagi CBS 11611 TaxID=1266666 RepID=A0A1G4JP96_9SACH|nr:LANO_0E01376g1_1 [Lachancea nothofagi CBS 11611]
MTNTVPKDTIARIFQACSFTNESTRITESTLMLVDEYLEVFVREAVLRSVENKERIKDEHRDQLGDQLILTHKDLENVSGLLLLDM